MINYIALLLLLVSSSKGQVKNFAEEDFETLKAKIKAESEDSLKLQIAYLSLNKAKYRFDTLHMADAYYFLAKLNSSNQLAYADSIINITKNKKYIRHPASSYLLKGNVDYELGNYKSALDFYLEASKYAKENGNESLFWVTKFNIGLLKNNIDEKEEAQTIFINYSKFLEQNKKEYKSSKNYSKVLFAIADSFIQSKQLDSAGKYIDIGIKQTLKNNDLSSYSNFVGTSGVHHFFLEKYYIAIDSLKKGKRLIQKYQKVKTRIATCDYYIARSYASTGEIEKSIVHFKKVDSILMQTKDVIPQLMDTYDYLIDYYKSKKNHEKQIECIRKQIKLDSIGNKDRVYLGKNIYKKFDTYELISEKNILTKQLEKHKFLDQTKIVILIIVFITLLFLFFYSIRRNYIHKRRFQDLFNQYQNKNFLSIDQVVVVPKKVNIDISDQVVTQILEQLHNFESSNRFSKEQYTLNSLAKELNTNSAYLSKIINAYKNVNFSTYINDLRIDFTVDQLIKNKSLRCFTIEAIAEEVGFKNRQSFSAAFYKKKGVYPSSFIKSLQNEK